MKKFENIQFKLEPYAAKYFNYTNIQKNMLIDILNWLNAGARPYTGNNKIPFYGLPVKDINTLFEYKADPGINYDISNAIKFMINRYGYMYNNFLYRGIGKIDGNKIIEKINNKKTIFQREKYTSISTDIQVAKHFASDDNNIKIGEVLTILCKNKMFNYDEFLFYVEVAHNILNIDVVNYSQQDIIKNGYYKEHEWLIPGISTWKIANKNQLIFNVSF